MGYIFKNGVIALGLVSTLSACQYEQLNRSEYMSPSAGNAIAHNSALQIADPWPRVAGDDDLQVPAIEYGGEPKSDAPAASPIIIQTTGSAQQ